MGWVSMHIEYYDDDGDDDDDDDDEILMPSLYTLHYCKMIVPCT